MGSHQESLAGTDLEDLIRFNEAIDQAVAESVAHYTKIIDNFRNLFLGILGHDLRNPVGAASMAAQWMKRAGPTDPRHPKMVSDLVRTTDRASRILDDLFDLTRMSFGTEIPVKKTRTDMLALCQSIADELRSIYEKQTIDVVHDGDTFGSWDAARMGQVMSNLIGNAIQYSASGPVRVTIAGTNLGTLGVSIHNFGTPIPVERQKTIFQSWMRGHVQDADEHPHLGLGLYIAKLIVEAHDGNIEVTSEETTGTTFKIRLPRS